MSSEQGAPCNYVGLRAVSGWPSLPGHTDCRNSMDRAARCLKPALKIDLTEVVQPKPLEGCIVCRQMNEQSSNVVEQTYQKMEK